MKKLATREGIVENGRVGLPSDAGLPDQKRVYEVPQTGTLSVRHGASPHLADPQQAEDFEMQVIEDDTEAGV